MSIMKPATKINEFMFDILLYCESETYLKEELEEELENFISKTPEKFYQTEDDKYFLEQRFDDYFIYSYVSRYYKKTPLEIFLSNRSERYSPQEQKILKGFTNNILSAFTIRDVSPGYYFIAKEFTTGKEYKVRENRATYRLKEGDSIIARIVSYEEDYALSVIHLYYLAKDSYELKRLWKSIPPDALRKITPLMIERLVFQEDWEEEREKKDLQSIEKRLEKMLKKYLGKKAPPIENLKKRLNRVNNPFTIACELANEIIFASEDELSTFLQLFMDFSNLTPRDDFDGKTPLEMDKKNKGPWEKRLSYDLMDYIQSKVDPSKFDDKNELQKAIEKYQNEWLHLPQEELDSKSPWTVILEERKRLGNPRKDFSIRISITPIAKKEKQELSLTNITPKDIPLAKDLETFVQYLGENKVKVTKKNQWIPFKHIKLMGKNFIHPDKDVFYFLGKEENWGQENAKRYIYLIDLLCRAASLIDINERGYLEINQNNFQTFQELPYGEKVFQLLITWIKKVKWEMLPFRDFVKPYARKYQERFNNILHLFSQYKINEKIAKELFLEHLYGTNLVKDKFSQEERDHLLIMIEFALLRYLEYFGVIASKKEYLFPEIPINSIKTFWVTPKGNRLINRLLKELY